MSIWRQLVKNLSRTEFDLVRERMEREKLNKMLAAHQGEDVENYSVEAWCSNCSQNSMAGHDQAEEKP